MPRLVSRNKNVLFQLQEKAEDRFIWGGNRSLVIVNPNVEDSGQYLCLRDNEYEAVHMVEVIDDEPTKQVHIDQDILMQLY